MAGHTATAPDVPARDGPVLGLPTRCLPTRGFQTSRSAPPLSISSSRDRPDRRDLGRAAHHAGHEAVVLGLVRSEPAVAIGVGLDLLDCLPGVQGGALSKDALEVEAVLRLNP